MRRRKSFIIVGLIIGVFVLAVGSATAKGPTATDPYNKPIPCLTQEGVCVMQTAEDCDLAKGKKLDCETCEECKKKGLIK